MAVKEMMFGTRTEFSYSQCGDCGSWQIDGVPENLSDHYPKHYPAFHAGNRVSRLTRWTRRLRLRLELAGGWLARLGAGLLGPLEYGREWMRGFHVTPDSEILEIGYGSGHRLRLLRSLGFRRLTGQDSFAPVPDDPDIEWTSVRIAELDGQFDWIEAHHVLEHLPDPAAELAALASRLAPQGGMVLRVPLSDSDAARRFGQHWVQWDAPRHLCLPSRSGVLALADRSGLECLRIIDDGDGFGYWGSVLYQKDIALMDAGSPFVGGNAYFTAEQLSEWDVLAAQARGRGESDQAAFVLRKRGAGK